MLLRVTVCLSHGLDGGVSILYRCLMCVPHMCLMCVPHLCALHVALPVCLTCVSLICPSYMREPYMSALYVVSTGAHGILYRALAAYSAPWLGSSDSSGTPGGGGGGGGQGGRNSGRQVAHSDRFDSKEAAAHGAGSHVESHIESQVAPLVIGIIAFRLVSTFSKVNLLKSPLQRGFARPLLSGRYIVNLLGH